MKDLNKMIARAIIAAQLCSDGGKRNRQLISQIRRLSENYHFWDTQWIEGYSNKTYWLNRAIQMINCSKEQIYHYWIQDSPDQNGYPSVIVYFNFKLDGKRHQVSFHTPANQVTGMLKRNKTGRKTRWDNKTGGSRESCLLLFKTYFSE